MYLDLTEAVKEAIQAHGFLRNGARDVLRHQQTPDEAADALETYILGQALPEARRLNPILAAVLGALVKQRVDWVSLAYELGWEPPDTVEEIPW